MEKTMNLLKNNDFKLNDKTKSHIIYVLTICFESQQKENITSTISFYELAGSENVAKAKTESIKPKQENIYKSLVTFNNVILKLSNNSKTFINFKESRLLLQLQPAFSQNISNKMIIIYNISQNPSCYHETMGTLLFASRAKAIKSFSVNTNNIQSFSTSSKKVDDSHFKNFKTCSSFNPSSFNSLNTSMESNLKTNIPSSSSKNNNTIEGKINTQNSM